MICLMMNYYIIIFFFKVQQQLCDYLFAYLSTSRISHRAASNKMTIFNSFLKQNVMTISMSERDVWKFHTI